MPSRAPFPFKKTTFKNGLRLITVPQKSTRAVTLLVLVGTGSKNETREINGISHFLEHMFFKGTRNRRTPLEISESVEEKGGVMNAFTTEELTGYYIKIQAAHVGLALDIESDIYLNSLLPKAEIEKEKGVVAEEINLYQDTPTRHIAELWMEVLYGDQPAGWNIAGNRETVSGLTRQKLMEYMRSQYVASNTVVCVAGNVEEEKIVRLVGKLFKDAPTHSFRKKAELREIQKEPQALVEYRETDQTHIALGAKGFTLLDKERYAQHILADLLGGMMSSRLFGELRERLGLAYYLSTMAEEAPDAGFLVTRAGVTNASTEKAIRAILREYKRVAKTPLSPRELQKGKEHQIGKMVLALESTDDKAEFYSMQEMLKGRMLTPDELYATIKAVRAEDVRRAAGRIFRPERLNLAVIGPFRDQERFRRMLKFS